MAANDVQEEHADPILEALSNDEKAELERKSFVKVGDEVVWSDPERGLRREAMSRLYYIQTTKGVFRVSRITREIVEV
jgi:hypothetical protein